MKEKSKIKKIPLALIIGVVVFIAVQIFLVHSQAFWRFCHFYSDPPNDDHLRYESILRTMPENDGYKKVFLIGSSQTRECFDIDYLNEVFGDYGYRFYNLGVAGSGQPIDMFMAKERLLKEKPHMLVYMPYVASFYSSYKSDRFNKMKMFFNPNILPFMKKHLGMKHFYEDRWDYAEAYFGRMVPIYRYRDQLKRISQRAFRNYLGIEKREAPSLFRDYAKKGPFNYDQFIEWHKDTLIRVNPYTELNKEVFDLFIGTVLDEDVKLLVINAPHHPRLRELYDDRIEGLLHDFLEEQSRKHGYSYIAKDEIVPLGKEYFVDFTHLTEDGRQIFTKFMADYLQGELEIKDFSSQLVLE